MSRLTCLINSRIGSMVSIALPFLFGIIISYTYLNMQNDVCFFTSNGISNSVIDVSPDHQRMVRYSGKNNTDDTSLHLGSSSSSLSVTKKPRKILLDCGANMASTVQLFRETYPGGHDFIIHSFELDSRLAPYFAPYSNHVLHCPMAVAAQNGSMTAYKESAWSPDKGSNNGKDMQWGGGTLFVDKAEQVDTDTGGRRKLAVRNKVPTVDISEWIQTHTSKDDYVIFKLDVEGAEFDILDKMMKDGTFEWIDKFYGEYHYHQPSDNSIISKLMTSLNVKLRGKAMLEWAAERRNYQDFKEIHPINNKKAYSGRVQKKCSTANTVSIVFLMSMNAKQAQKLFAVLHAYRRKLPITLFLYGDFVELFPELVTSWATHDHVSIGIRGDFQYPAGHIDHMNINWVREGVVSSQVRLSELHIPVDYYYPSNVSANILTVAKSRALTIIQPSAAFPPVMKDVDWEEYYKYRDVERIPKALRNIHEQLQQSQGGVLSLDADLPDTHMIIVFLLDFLVDNSGYNIVPLNKCL